MPKFLAIAGLHNSGKTTVGTYVLSRLIEMGYKVGVIKSTKEKVEETDRVDSDTYRYRLTGSSRVMLFQGEKATLYLKDLPQDKRELLDFLTRFFSDCDLVLCEGFKEWEEIPKLWVKSQREEEAQIRDKVKNVVLDLLPEEGDQALQYVEGYLAEEEESLEIMVEGRKIPLKPYLQRLCQNLILAFLSSLKWVPERLKSIEIKIKRKV